MPLQGKQRRQGNPGIPRDAGMFKNGSAACLLRAPPSVNTLQLHLGSVSERNTDEQLESRNYEILQ